MKHRIIFFCLAALAIAACGKKESGKQEPEEAVINLAQLVSKAAETKAEFSAKIGEAVVTCVCGNHAHLQDTSGAILVSGADRVLSKGQVIGGKISGEIVRLSSVPQISGLDLGKADLSVTRLIPETELTIVNLLGAFDKYLSCRVLIKDVTVETGTSAGQRNGKIKLGTRTCSIYAANDDKPAVIEAGCTGDLVCYPSYLRNEKVLLIYTEDQFFIKSRSKERDVDGEPEVTAFTALTVPGYYKNTDTQTPRPIYAYDEDTDQIGFGTRSSSSLFYLFNLEGNRYIKLELNSASPKIEGSYGGTETIDGVMQSHMFKVVARTDAMIWLENKSAAQGFIFKIK